LAVDQFKPTVEKWSGNTTPLLRTKRKLCLNSQNDEGKLKRKPKDKYNII